MLKPKPCPACNNEPVIKNNGLVFTIYCESPSCLNREAQAGASDLHEALVIQEWNSVIVPSVTEQLQKEYEATTNSGL